MKLYSLLKFTATFAGILLVASCSNTATTPGASATSSARVSKLVTLDSPGRSSEILSYSRTQGLLLATNSVELEVAVARLSTPAAANPQFIDFNASKSGIQGIQFGGEPTSLAAHPSRALGLAAVNGGGGRLVVFDLAAAARGETKIVLDQKVGIQLDSIAVSPNGRWAVIADEAEGSASTEGGIVVVDLSGLGSQPSLPVKRVAGLAAALGRPAGRVEPEYVSIDSSSSFAAVSCQEDSAIALVRLGASPSLASVIKLPAGAEPDGVHLYDMGGTCLLAIAEEGRDTASFYAINKSNLSAGGRLISRVDVRNLAGNGYRSDPEGVYLFKQGGTLFCAVGVERANRVLILNMSQLSKPVKETVVGVGSRPEGVIALQSGGSTIIISADEGKPGKGELSFIKVR